MTERTYFSTSTNGIKASDLVYNGVPGLIYSTNTAPPWAGQGASLPQHNPYRPFVFNEHSMLLQVTRGFTDSYTYKVLRFSVEDSMQMMREHWRFEVESPHDQGGRRHYMVVADECEAYLKPGTRRPRDHWEKYQDSKKPSGQMVQDEHHPPTSQEDSEMAQRQTFTFDYTGEEIAKAIDAKIADVQAKITKATEFDLDALVEAGVVDVGKKLSIEGTVKSHQAKIETWKAEQRPYAKAAKQVFALDAEDVAHFGL